MKNKSFVQSLNNAVNGLIQSLKSERNMRFHIAAAVGVLILSMFYSLTREQFLIVLLTVGLVLISELFNTSVEIIVDIITPVYHPKAKVIKDIAAGGVFVSAAISLVVAYFIFFDNLSNDLETGIERIKKSPIHIIFISLLLTIIAVIVLKMLTKKGTPFSGGMPSGHAAVSMTITTGVALWTENAYITIFCLIVALLVIQSRLEGKIHNIIELIGGSILGFLITVFIYKLLSQ